MNINTSPQDTNVSNPASIKATKSATAEVIITPNLIAQLRKDIAKIGTDSIEAITKRQAVILLLPEITDARARKVSFKGVEAAATIGTYWRQAMADIEAAKPKSLKPAPEVTAVGPAPAMDIAPTEQKVDAVEMPKTTLVFRDITDDDEFEDNTALLRRMSDGRKLIACGWGCHTTEICGGADNECRAPTYFQRIVQLGNAMQARQTRWKTSPYPIGVQPDLNALRQTDVTPSEICRGRRPS